MIILKDIIWNLFSDKKNDKAIIANRYTRYIAL